jgi:glutathione S-transferase
MRLYAFANRGVIPQSVLAAVDALPNFSEWAEAVRKHDSVTHIWDEDTVVEASVKRFALLKEQRLKAQQK